MEGLGFGWKKSVKCYHYHSSGEMVSLCGISIYAISDFKEIQFFTDFEITAEMQICPQCRSLRQHEIKHEIVDHTKRNSETINSCSTASIDVPCANQECNSGNIDLISSNSEIISSIDGFKHKFKCNDCLTEFSIFTTLLETKIPEGTLP